MKKSSVLATALATLSLMAAPNADRPDARHAWAVHDDNRPNPPQVLCEEGQIPSDAIVLFDGTQKSIDEHWTDKKGGPSQWVLKDNAFYCVPKSGMTYAKDKASDFQLHLEFMIPDPPGPGLGNTGVYVHGLYEVQVLHSYFNMNKFDPAPPWKHANYADGQMGAIYGQNPPLVTACRQAGHWQTMDIVFHASHWEGEKLVEPARITAFINGLLVQDNWPLEGPTEWCLRMKHNRAEEVPERSVVAFQDHGHPCPYRNVWYRKIPSRRANTVHGGDYFNAADCEALKTKLAAETRAKAKATDRPEAKLVYLWESYAYHADAAVKAEIEAMTPSYIARIAAWEGEIDDDRRLELSNMGGFVRMAVRNGLFTEQDALYQAVTSALKRTRSVVKHY